MRVAVSGSGNVAQYAIEKAMAFGARVVTASDSSGTVVDESGFTPEKLARLCEIKASRDGRVADYAREFGLTYLEGQQPWSVPVDIALPCATQNELDVDAARVLIANGVKAVAEGANMPTTIEATDLFLEAGVLFAPGKAANAGGVATSGLEMAQNAARLSWKAEKVDARLHHIMLDIHHACVEYGGDNKHTNYVQGANIAGFVKVADACWRRASFNPVVRPDGFTLIRSDGLSPQQAGFFCPLAYAARSFSCLHRLARLSL